MAWTYSREYPEPGKTGSMIDVGMLVPGYVAAPPARLQQIRAEGRKVRGRIEGVFLLDTGAFWHSCVNRIAAEELGLQRLNGDLMVVGWGEPTPSLRYHAAMAIELRDEAGHPVYVGREGEMISPPNVDLWVVKMAREWEWERPNLLGIIGRQFLAHFTLTVHGHERFELVHPGLPK